MLPYWPVGQHHLVIRILKGIFNLRPKLPKNVVTWDPSIALQYIKTLGPSAGIPLILLAAKVATLIWLLAAQRGQSLTLIDIRNLRITKFSVTFAFGDLLKTTRPGFQQKEIKIVGYPPDRRLCLVTALNIYLARTKPLRGRTNSLFITTQKPHGPASQDTVTRWVRSLLSKAGLDLSIFTPHSIRGASASAASSLRVPLSTIMETAGWTQESTFRKFYKKTVKSKGNLSQAILEASNR